MAKQPSLATPTPSAHLPGSREPGTNTWRTGLKTAASVLRGAIRDSDFGLIPKRATAYYLGVSDIGEASRNEEWAHLQEVEASLLKALESERSSDAATRLLVLLDEVRTKIKNSRS